MTSWAADEHVPCQNPSIVTPVAQKQFLPSTRYPPLGIVRVEIHLRACIAHNGRDERKEGIVSFGIGMSLRADAATGAAVPRSVPSQWVREYSA
jgi:hypothetical protein